MTKFTVRALPPGGAPFRVGGGPAARNDATAPTPRVAVGSPRQRGSGSGSRSGASGLVEWAGASALLEGAEWLDRIYDASGASLLVRRPWLQSWARAFPGWDPWLLALVDEDDVRAVAPLARRRRRSCVEVVSLGDDALAESPLVACDDLAATELAAAVAGALRSLGHPWMLRLRQLPVGSALVDGLVSQVSDTVTFPGPPRPVLRFVDDRPPRQWLSRNTASALAKARNRIGREAHRLEVSWVRSRAEIQALLPGLVSVHRDRDLELRGTTLLDDAEQAGFYREVIERHAGSWRLLVVRIDESLAAYALCLQDASTLHVWDNRVAPQFKRYSAGLIANAELVLRAAGDRSLSVLDWGAGEQRYKSSLSNDAIEAQALVAWSSPVLHAVLGCQNRIEGLRPRWRGPTANR